MTSGSPNGPFRSAPLVAIAMALFAAHPGAAQLTEPLSPCSLEGFEGSARCGILEVTENPARPDGRRIPIRIAVIPNRTGATGGPPIAVLAGGPGQAATDLAGFAAQIFDPLRENRDILLVDARGTGGSHPLDCPGFDEPSSPAAYTGAMFEADRVRRCRRELSEVADLAQYTTTRIADDMARVWRALAHERVDVYGTSYGTRLALEIVRRHPDRVRALVLKGTAPMELRMPLDYPRDGQRSLDRILEHCRAEAPCAGAYPRIDVELVEVLDALERGVDVHLRHPAGGDTATVRLHRAPVVQAFVALLQNTGTAIYVPRLIHAAAEGAWEPLASFALFYRVSIAGALYEGMFLSVTCAEDLPFIDPEDAALTAEDTFLGLARYADQAAACDLWDVPAVDPAFREPVTASVPALVISGNYDPVTPPRWGRRVARRLAPSYHLVVPEGSHSFAGMGGCVDPIIARFLETGTLPETADPCVDEVRLGPFSLPGEPWPPLLQPPEGREDL